jgi:hypothetical protein
MNHLYGLIDLSDLLTNYENYISDLKTTYFIVKFSGIVNFSFYLFFLAQEKYQDDDLVYNIL